MTRTNQQKRNRNRRNRSEHTQNQQSNRNQNSRRRNRRGNRSNNPNNQDGQQTGTKIKFKETTASMLRKAELKQKNKNSNKQNKRQPKKGKKGREKISDHFAKADFLCPHCVELKLERKPFRISLGLIGALEQLRTALGERIEIIKGFECVESNEIRKSFKKNYHTMGLAAELQCPSVELDQFLNEALKIAEIKYIVANYDDNSLYIDTRKEETREVFEIRKKEKKELKVDIVPVPPVENPPSISISSEVLEGIVVDESPETPSNEEEPNPDNA